ncbi:unnamed protein product [Notodromas monacha]|uniref:Hexosyltransferase n=1 Tax=Notodromas monacha TaxID=399045 RepID=A0A7R9BU66_9CRUS|nr:unnamed protein product [Notodromas monacha]CAG0921477.1 unnamed protein product [Notodromas monacha]
MIEDQGLRIRRSRMPRRVVSRLRRRIILTIVTVGIFLTMIALETHFWEESHIWGKIAWSTRCFIPFMREPLAELLVAPNVTMPDGSVRKCTKLAEVFVPGFRIPTKNACDEGVRLLVTVISHPKNLTSRNAIRATWGNMLKETGYAQVLFFFGRVRDRSTQKRINAESQVYRDIVQTNNPEDWKTLVLKEYAALIWIKTHCRNVKAILKTDDDVYVNPKNLIQYFETVKLKENVITGVKNPGLCNDWNQRDFKNLILDSSLPDNAYPLKHYPPHLAMNYFYTFETLGPLIDAGKRINFWAMNGDLFISGLLTALANVTVVNDARFAVLFGDTALNLIPSSRTWKFFFSQAIVVAHNPIHKPHERHHLYPEALFQIHKILFGSSLQ